jgi:hypothetical protein
LDLFEKQSKKFLEYMEAAESFLGIFFNFVHILNHQYFVRNFLEAKNSGQKNHRTKK